jgi:hypothetical protein
MVKGEVMGEVKNKKPRNRRRPRKPQYQRHPFATSITLYSADGSPVLAVTKKASRRDYLWLSLRSPR